jgi:hypothetical protein
MRGTAMSTTGFLKDLPLKNAPKGLIFHKNGRRASNARSKKLRINMRDRTKKFTFLDPEYQSSK